MLPDWDEIASLLNRWSEVSQLHVLDYETDAGIVWLIKVRANLPDGYQMQIRLRLRGNSASYSYQLFRDRPIIRWDNAPHYPGVATFPHHFHDNVENIHPSRLSGDPLVDLPVVLTEMLDYIRTHRI